MIHPTSFESFLDELHDRFGDALASDLGISDETADFGRVALFSEMFPETFKTLRWLQELREEVKRDHTYT